jgi:hypothetical protein
LLICDVQVRDELRKGTLQLASKLNVVFLSTVT